MKKPQFIYLFLNTQTPNALPLAMVYEGTNLGERLETAFQSTLAKVEIQYIVVQKCKI